MTFTDGGAGGVETTFTDGGAGGVEMAFTEDRAGWVRPGMTVVIRLMTVDAGRASMTVAVFAIVLAG